MTVLATVGGDQPGGTGLIILLALLWAAGYLAASAFWPFRACRRCDGAARLRSPSHKAWRPCPRCRGTGRRIRLGRRVWDWIRPGRDT